MSLILDALRKSERTRQQTLTGQLGAAETPPGPARLAVPWVTLLVILLVINALVLAVFFWRSGAHPTAPAAAATPPASYHPEVRPLSEEAGPALKAAPSAAAALQPAPGARATTPAAAPPPSPPSAGPVVAQNADAGVPSLATLSMEVRQTLPALHLDVLGYAMKPGDRFVVINFQRYRIGDSTAEGVQVADIVPGGAVLEYRGTRFLLPP